MKHHNANEDFGDDMPMWGTPTNMYAGMDDDPPDKKPKPAESKEASPMFVIVCGLALALVAQIIWIVVAWNKS